MKDLESADAQVQLLKKRNASPERRREPARISFYIRISTAEHHQKYSLGAQRERLEAFCKAQWDDDWRLHKVYRDTESGTHMHRPGLEEMLCDAEGGLFDTLLVFRVDRLSRKVRELAQMVDELTKYGVALKSITEPLKRFSNRPCTTWGGRGTSARTDAGGPMRAYSMDLRERALLDSDAGMKAADVAAKYRVSGSWVRRLKQRRRDTGEVAPRVQRQGRRGMLEPHLHTLAALMAAHPDRTRAERKDALATPASVPTVWRAVRALGLTVKNNGPPVRTRSA